jgi:hypothetical protein
MENKKEKAPAKGANIVKDLSQIKPGFNTIIIVGDNPDAVAYQVTETLNDLDRAETLIRCFGVQLLPVATKNQFTRVPDMVIRGYMFVELQ